VTLATLALRFDVIAIGVMAGLGYALLAAGLVLVFRATRVINLAHGQIGAFAAALLAVLVHRTGVPYPIALVLAVATGALIGVVTERALVRPLLERSRLAVLVGTIGVTQLLLVALIQLPKVIGHRFPTPFEWTQKVGSLVLHGEHAALLVLGPLVLAGLTYLITRTRYGLAIRGVADNQEAAELAGVSARRVSTLVWALAGGLAAISAILTLPLSGSAGIGAAAAPALGPGLLLRALAAGLVGRLTNLPRTIAAGLAIGVVEGVLYATYPADQGLVDLVLFAAIMAMLLLRRSTTSGGDETLTFGRDPEPLPERIRNHPKVRRVRRAALVGGCGAALLAPLVYSTSSDLYLLARVPIFAMVGISIVMLTGWAGQLSLGQVAFVGVGAMGTAALASRGVPYGAAMGYTTIAGFVLAAAIGTPALRLRGLLLTVTTLGFAVAASSWLLTRDLFSSSDLDTAMIHPGQLGPFDFESYRTDYYLCLAGLLVVVLVARRFRSTGVGRTVVAVEGNEQSAAAMTVSPAMAKLTAFAVAGGIATFAGGLLAGVSRTFQVDLFAPEQSLQVLAMAVVGGVGSIGGAIIGAIYLIGVPNLLGDTTSIRLATSGIGLLVILRFEPTGLVGVLHRVRTWAVDRYVEPEARPLVEAPGVSDAVAISRSLRATPRNDAPGRDEVGPPDAGVPALDVRGVSVRIGGRAIVHEVDLHVVPGEVVGLIGANGAGKSTLMNAIGGFVPAEGTVELFGEPLEHLAPVHRARAGLGRSFQSAQLYPRLTVRECVQVALESQRRSELVPSLLGLPPSVAAERWSRDEADRLLDQVGLSPRAEQLAGDLSTGTRRVVEFACLLAMRPRVVLLDEPMAGIAQREAEAFGPLLLDVRAALGASMVVIEHDLPLVTSISDRLYCLESGAVIAHGSPDEVRNDPLVVASYLGTDRRAIERSGALAGKGAS
jgi:ABC-type branched-subunit amino acid transport system ATPase component/ABC-type branched-subunit amino acid transport system permease subunit